VFSHGANAATVLTPEQAYSLTSFSYQGFSIVGNTLENLGGGSGQIDLTGAGSNAGEILATWCLDIFHDLTTSDTYSIATNTIITTGFTNNGGYSGGTILSPSQLSEIGALVHWGDTNLSADPSVNSPATQLAIWTIEDPTIAPFTAVYDSGNPGTPDAAINTLVGTLVAEAEDNTLGPSASLEGLVDPGNNQGLVFEVATTPLPSTWTMLIAGFAGLGYFAYGGTKRRSAPAAAVESEDLIHCQLFYGGTNA
jgi:hypothetical protein